MALADPTITDVAWAHCVAVLRPVLALAPVGYINDVAGRLAKHSIQAAVVDHDTGAICEWMLHLIDRQGISNHAAIAFAERQGRVNPARSKRSADCPAVLSAAPKPLAF